MTEQTVDLLIVGGGINGVGIARDAAGRGLSVALVEQGDLGCATSSASSKLIHGGLRYLQQGEFRLVAEALYEREVLLRSAPHIVRPVRFVMPHVKGLRPEWMIRLGLFLYDHLSRRDLLPRSRVVEFTHETFANMLKDNYRRGFEYSDCWADDARLVIANARAAADRGALILPRTTCVSVERIGSHWRAHLRNGPTKYTVVARAIVNAAGPWAATFLRDIFGSGGLPNLKLVQGSHIVVPAIYEGRCGYTLQNDDGRVVFAYPYEGDFTVIGTTDVETSNDPRDCHVSEDEIAYLCAAANRYFCKQVHPNDVVWSFCGVRALIDDGAENPTTLSRDYRLDVDGSPSRAPIISVLGGKITTYRKLAERALRKLRPWLPHMGRAWTATAVLPGGAIPMLDVAAYRENLRAAHPNLPLRLLRNLVDRHGTRTSCVLRGAVHPSELGEYFGADLYAREVDYLVTHEWALTTEDILWRRTKAGLHLSSSQRQQLAAYLTQRDRALQGR